jgi:hypothetical protein
LHELGPLVRYLERVQSRQCHGFRQELSGI